MANDEGVKLIAKGVYAIRVKRIDRSTGRQANRKATVKGTRADALRVRDELRAELGSTVTKRARIRLSEFAASWLELRKGAGLKGSTLRRYGHSLEHILPALGDVYLDALSPSHIKSYMADRMKDDAGGYSVLNELRCLRTMAKDAISDGYVEKDWCDRVPAPPVSRYTKDRPNLLTPEQMIKVLKKVSKRWYGLVLFMTTTGLRWGEASALHWEQCDFKAGEATIIYGNDKGELITPKNKGSYRTVPIVPEVAKEWGMRRKRGPIFVTAKGTLHKGTPLIKVLTKACKAAEVPRVTAHGLRRTFNNLARQLASREVLKSITGHTTDAMVEHYSFVSSREKLTASQAVARSIGVTP